jgi:hypothetical protein
MLKKLSRIKTFLYCNMYFKKWPRLNLLGFIIKTKKNILIKLPAKTAKACFQNDTSLMDANILNDDFSDFFPLNIDSWFFSH